MPKTTKSLQTIDTYIKNFPKETQVILRKIRRIIKEIAPKATEKISYGIPTFNLNGTYLIYFSGWQHHISLYPASDKMMKAVKEALPYRVSKGTLRFPLNKPIPYPLIKKIIRYRLKDNLHTFTNS